MTVPNRRDINSDAVAKRLFDVVCAVLLIVPILPLLILLCAAAKIETGEPGLFRQVRIGRYGRPFDVLKVRTMRTVEGSTNTASGDERITRLGRRLRDSKLDELPQLANVLLGEMSLVGPRPDVPGYADKLTGNDRRILDVRPGITGLASVIFANEEQLLASVEFPDDFNRELMYPLKVELNTHYVDCRTLLMDVQLLIASSVPGLTAPWIRRTRNQFDFDTIVTQWNKSHGRGTVDV